MKKIFTLLLAAVLLLSLVACSGNNTQTAQDAQQNDTLSGGENDNTTPPATDDQQVEANAPTASPKILTPTPPPTIGSDATPLAVGETISSDNCEFYVDYTNITADVIPPTPGSWYSHYEAELGKVYIDICVSYKNLGTRNISADEVMSATLIYSGRYQYTGFTIIEKDSRSNFTYSNMTSIAPLSMEYLHYLFKVPEEFENSDNMMTALIIINGEEYLVTVRDGSEGDVSAISDGASDKTSGEVAAKETVAIAGNCEFYVDYSDITNDVMPRTPGSYYSHYQADDGKTYVDICIAYKNLSYKKVGADDVLYAKLTYSGKYEYSGFSMIEEDNRSNFTYSSFTSISPLTTEYLHYLFEIPAEVETSGESISVAFTLGGNTYSYMVR